MVTQSAVQSDTHVDRQLPGIEGNYPIAKCNINSNKKLRVARGLRDVNGKQIINQAITKHRKWKVFQTVNHSRIIWDPKVKPKGLFGGHLNIRSIVSKSDQIQHLLMESNLDFLCLSETWLHENSPTAALNIPGYQM